MKMIPISNLTPATSKTKLANRLPMKRFWEYLLMRKSIEPVWFVAPEEGYTSLSDGNIKEMKEYFVHKGSKKVNGKDTFPEIVCTSGTDIYSPKPCLGCYLYENTKVAKGIINPWRKSLTTKWQVLHLAFYHSIPRLDDTGSQVVVNDKPQFNKEICLGNDCKRCSEGFPRSFGRLMKIDLGPSHSKNLLGHRKDLYWTCQGCMLKIVTNALICPECDSNVANINIKNVEGKDLNEKLDRIRITISEDHKCMKCGYVGRMIEGNDCLYNDDRSSKKRNKKCPFEAPVRGDIFGSVVFLTKEGEKSNSTLVMKRFYSIFGTSSDPYELPEEVLAEYPNMALEDILEAIKVKAIQENGGLFDLDKEVEVFMLPLEQQAEVLGVPLPSALASGPRTPKYD